MCPAATTSGSNHRALQPSIKAQRCSCPMPWEALNPHEHRTEPLHSHFKLSVSQLQRVYVLSRAEQWMSAPVKALQPCPRVQQPTQRTSSNAPAGWVAAHMCGPRRRLPATARRSAVAGAEFPKVLPWNSGQSKKSPAHHCCTKNCWQAPTVATR